MARCVESAFLVLAVSLVIARLVSEPNAPMPELADDAILLVQRHGTYVGCPKPPTGTDAGVPDAPADAGTDAGVPDAGVPGDGGVPPMCESIEGDAITMVVRPRFTVDTTGAKFAVLFVTPSRPIVETVPDQFVELAALTAPLTEFREIEVQDPALGTRCTQSGCYSAPPQQESSGCGVGFDGSSFNPPGIGDAQLGDGGVGIETVGPYEIVRATPADATALGALLDSFNYRYEQADLDAVAPYLARGYTVVAVRVAMEPGTSVPGGRAMTPLAMTWAGTEMRVPVALGSESVDLKVYIAGDGRFDLPGADVTFAQPNYWTESFLTLNILHAITGGSPDEDPVAVRVGGDPAFHETNIVEKFVHVPVNTGPCQDDDYGCCRMCSTGKQAPFRVDWATVGVVVLGLLLRRRGPRRRPTANR